MIAKLETGNGFAGAVRYAVRAGQSDKMKYMKVIAVKDVSFDYDGAGHLIIEPNQVGFDFRQQTMAYTGKGVIRKPVYHWVLSYAPTDHVTNQQMYTDAKEFMKQIGFSDTQYVMAKHSDKKHQHLHIICNIVNNQGKRIPTMGLIDKAHAAAAAITKANGYTWGEPTKKVNITKEKMHKPHERARETIEPIIRKALAASTSLNDFQLCLIDEYTIMCNYTVAKDGKRGRMSFCVEFEGQQHSFKASDVAKDLSFSYVAKALADNSRKVVAATASTQERPTSAVSVDPTPAPVVTSVPLADDIRMKVEKMIRKDNFENFMRSVKITQMEMTTDDEGVTTGSCTVQCNSERPFVQEFTIKNGNVKLAPKKNSNRISR